MLVSRTHGQHNAVPVTIVGSLLAEYYRCNVAIVGSLLVEYYRCNVAIDVM